MSLKAFHVFFVCVSILLAFGFGSWELYTCRHGGGTLDASLGIGSILAGVGLLVYLRAVIKKLRNLDSP